MACAGCQEQARQTSGPCRTFTFPLGAGSVDIVVRGDVSPGDATMLPEYAIMTTRLLATILQKPGGPTDG